jgi:hypothetical protein
MKSLADGTRVYQIAEGTISVGTSAATASSINSVNLSVAHKIEIVNKGPNEAYYRLDGTTPTADANGNADMIPANEQRLLEKAECSSIKHIASAGESATLFVRLYY